jgi:hypothetical protein
MRAKEKNNRGSLVGLVGLVQPVGVRRLSDRPQPSRVGRVLVGLVGCWSGWSGPDPRDPSHSIPNVAPGGQQGASCSSSSGTAAGQQRGQLGSGGSSGSGGNGPQPPGAGNRPTQKEPFRATFSGRRGLGYTPPALRAAQRGVSVRSCPSRHPGHSLRQTIRSPCRIRCGIGGGPVRWTGGG